MRYIFVKAVALWRRKRERDTHIDSQAVHRFKQFLCDTPSNPRLIPGALHNGMMSLHIVIF